MVTAPKQITTCRDAIKAVWPAELQDKATIVLTHENRREDPKAVGAVNVGGSRDYGCFQINDYWHKPFFQNNDWTDPVANAKYAYDIYKGREQKTGNGWQAWYAVKSILW